jgi:hypothetical protein
MTTDAERASWRKAFEMIGPETLRLRLENRPTHFPPEYARQAELWLLEKDAEVRIVETRRFNTIRLWTIAAAVAGAVAAVAGIVAAIASIIAALPVLKGS